MGLMLLDGVHPSFLPHARQKLEHVRLPSLKTPGMPEFTRCMRVSQQGSCALPKAPACKGRRRRSAAAESAALLKHGRKRWSSTLSAGIESCVLACESGFAAI